MKKVTIKTADNTLLIEVRDNGDGSYECKIKDGFPELKISVRCDNGELVRFDNKKVKA